jgi:hypothetical protein
MAATPEGMDRPIFIIGTQRSGTTLLRLILDSHPNIAVGFETGFMRAVKTIKHIPDYAYGKDWYRRWGLDEADMNARIREFYGGIFAQYAQAQGKRRWGEKTPLNLFQYSEMAAIFPDAQFVCIVRHPGAVAASMMRWKYTFEDAVSYWVKANRIVRRTSAALGPQRAFLTRYEDLVTDPRRVLTDVMAFLDEPWSDDLLRHHEIQAERDGDNKVEGGTRSDRPLDHSGLDAWRERLTADQRAALKEQARPLLRYYGYRAKTAVPADPCPAVPTPAADSA